MSGVHQPEERSCYTCLHSPPPQKPAGCSALAIGDEGDPIHDAIVDYCEESGANYNDGWPMDLSVRCKVWVGRPR